MSVQKHLLFLLFYNIYLCVNENTFCKDFYRIIKNRKKQQIFQEKDIRIINTQMVLILCSFFVIALFTFNKYYDSAKNIFNCIEDSKQTYNLLSHDTCTFFKNQMDFC